MELQQTEQTLKTYHRHLFPYLWLAIRTSLVALPFYLLAYIFSAYLSEIQLLTFVFVVTIGLGLLLSYISLLYWLDKLVITNQRVLFVNWKTLLSREEDSTDLIDIQDIATHEFGFLSAFKLFDFGTLTITTASPKIGIIFDSAPNPEGIKNMIESIRTEYCIIKPEREHREIEVKSETPRLEDIKSRTDRASL